MGAVYVEVDASVANGIMTMDASGGNTGGGYWINWTSNGYTNNGWFWEDNNNYLKIGWAAAVESGGGYVGEGCSGDGEVQGHTTSYESFLIHMRNGHAENLNAVLGNWDNDSKLQFVLDNAASLGGCVTSSGS